MSLKAGRLLTVGCFLVGLAGQAMFLWRVWVLGFGWQKDAQVAAGFFPWIANLSLLLVFGLQHSGMTRAAFKAWWTRLIPRHLERSLYWATSGLAATVLVGAWQPLPGEPLWHGPGAMGLLSALGLLGIILGSRGYDGLRFCGLQQGWNPERMDEPETLNITGPYRFVRHPLMICLFLFLWGVPVMPVPLAFLSGGLTVYVLLALPLEERDLVRRFGAAYEDYRQQVPALFPWRWPVPAATHFPQSGAKG